MVMASIPRIAKPVVQSVMQFVVSMAGQSRGSPSEKYLHQDQPNIYHHYPGSTSLSLWSPWTKHIILFSDPVAFSTMADPVSYTHLTLPTILLV